jgi:hypothetical protein
LFGIPPPNQDPKYEADFVKRSPKERLEGFIYGMAVVTLLVVVAAVVMIVV